MKLRSGWLMCIAAVVAFSVAASAQMTIDATGPHKEPRKTSISRCGSIGRKLPVQVAVDVVSGEKGKTVVDFILTNAGTKELSIPISPDPDQVEPADSLPNHSMRRLSLYITSDARRERILPGRTRLYGNDQSATLVTLAPGESIRVRAEVVLPQLSHSGQSQGLLVAHAVLVEETVSTANGETLRDCTEDFGSATSPEYTFDALFKSGE